MTVPLCHPVLIRQLFWKKHEKMTKFWVGVRTDRTNTGDRRAMTNRHLQVPAGTFLCGESLQKKTFRPTCIVYIIEGMLTRLFAVE